MNTVCCVGTYCAYYLLPHGSHIHIHMSIPRPIFGVETQQSRLRVQELKLPLTLVSSRVTLEEDWSCQHRLCVSFTERVLSTVLPLAFILETGEIHSTSIFDIFMQLKSSCACCYLSFNLIISCRFIL